MKGSRWELRLISCLVALWLSHPRLIAQEGHVRKLGVSEAFLHQDWVVTIGEDSVLRVENLSTGEKRSTELRVWLRFYDLPILQFSGDWVMVLVWESEQETDLNGDGDTEDYVVHLHNLASGETRNLMLASLDPGGAIDSSGAISNAFTGNSYFVMLVPEVMQGHDLNGDGDLEDNLVHVHDLSTGQTTNTELEVPSL